MIVRLLKSLSTLLICLCVGTVIAEILMIGFISSKWQLDDQKITQMLAIAQGYDLVELRDEAEKLKEVVSVEQPSFEEIVEARAAKARDLELCEAALSQDVAQYRHEKQKLAEENRQFQLVRDAFEARLAGMEDQEKKLGFEENITMLQNMKPKQAKQQLVQMYVDGQIGDVVRLMAHMNPSKRKRICGEFKTEEENQMLGDVLQRIRDGYPLAIIAEETEKTLTQTNSL